MKRAQAASQEGASPRADRPWTPAPMPDPGLARRRRMLRLLIPLIGLGVATLVGMVWLRPKPPEVLPAPRAENWMDESPGAARAPTEASALPAPTPLPERPPPTGRAPLQPEAGVEGQAPAEIWVPPPPRAAQELTSGRTYAGAVTLADGGKIELGGIVWSETEPRALLNDKILGVGSYVEGFTVAGIEIDRVELRKDSLTIFLSVQ